MTILHLATPLFKYPPQHQFWLKWKWVNEIVSEFLCELPRHLPSALFCVPILCVLLLTVVWYPRHYKHAWLPGLIFVAEAGSSGWHVCFVECKTQDNGVTSSELNNIASFSCDTCIQPKNLVLLFMCAHIDLCYKEKEQANSLWM